MTINKNNSIIPVKGGVCAASGYAASGLRAGIKKLDALDLGLVHSRTPCKAAGVFTQNAVRAACIDWNKKLLPAEDIHAICCNSGNANACTGKRGERDIIDIASALASLLGIKKRAVLSASTGVIGEFLPVDKIHAALPALASSLSPKQGRQFATAIMTTDTVQKECAVRVSFSRGDATIGGCAKGAGMIHPNMATMLCFITTDIDIDVKTLDRILKKSADMTFNNLSVDGDTSTNDMVLVLANGCSSVCVQSKQDLALFEQALFEVCNTLCAKIARDGEGATKRIEITAKNGKTYAGCRKAAKSVANSNLVKTAIFGNDPNWGRILCAVGYSGAQFSPKNLTVSLCGIPVFQNQRPAGFDKNKMIQALKKEVVPVEIDLGYGTGITAISQTCDLTYDYIKVNADYHT